MSDQTTSIAAVNSGAEPDYGASYYLNYWGGGGPYERNERWMGFFGGVAEALVREFHPTSALDAGCALGLLVEALRDRGVDASGIDVSEYAISQVPSAIAEHCEVASLTEPLDEHYDLITCIEVLEHLPPNETDKALDNLCNATDRLVISTTPQDFGEPTHLNVQPPEAWSTKLAERGFMRDLERDLSYLSPWAALYTRRAESQAETVRRYDRAWWRLRREAAEVRQSLLQSQERVAELEAGGERDEEILRLRDLLIGKDAELGAIAGRLAELEERWRRITQIARPDVGMLKKIARSITRR